MPDPPARPKRFWLYAPYAALVLAALAWSLWWLYAAHLVAARMDAAQTKARAGGFELAWTGRRIAGYPFRLDVTLEAPRAAEPSGWVLGADSLKGEAYAYAPEHWVIVAPQGVSLTRPGAGTILVRGQALRASVVAIGPGAPRVSVEGLKLAFTPQPGAKGLALTGAEGFGFHLRQAGGDTVELFMRIDRGHAPASGLLGAVGEGGPVSLAWQATLSKAAEAHGPDWPSAVRAWAMSGGGLTTERGTLTAGRTAIELKGGELRADPQGYLSGALDLNLTHAPQLLATLAARAVVDPLVADSAAPVAAARQGSAPAAPVELTFQAGRATLGPVAVGPAPRLY